MPKLKKSKSPAATTLYVVKCDEGKIVTGRAYTSKETADMAMGMTVLMQMVGDNREFRVAPLVVVDCKPEDLLPTLRAQGA